jgi:hypothetical protein
MAINIGKAKISNSFRGLRFVIEKRDIRDGQPGDPCGCAAARALRRHFDAKETFVYRDVTYILKKDGTALRYHTSAPLRLETIVFDRNGEFYPGEYDLEPAPIKNTTKAKSKGNGSSSSSSKRNSVRERRGIPNVRPTASQRLPQV